MSTGTRPRVLFINRSYWPDTEATGQLLTDLCEDLSPEFELTVVAGLPNHLPPAASMPAAGLDRHGDVTVRRVPHTRFAKHSFLGRITNLVSFTLSAFLKTQFLPRPDVIVTETDPFFLPLLGRWLKWRYGCRYVAYLQDVYPDIAVAVGKVREGIVTRVLRSLLVGAYRRADRVVVLSRCMARRCIANGVPESLFEVIPNWVDTRQIVPVKSGNRFRDEQQLGGLFTVMYSGNLGVGHLLMPVLEAAERLRDQPDILFVLIGEGAQKQVMIDWCLESSLQNVRFLTYQPRELLGHSLSAADIQIVSLRPEVVGCMMPSKLYGVLAAGTPVLAICPPESELAQVVNDANAGTVCDASSPDLPTRIAEAVREFRQNADRTATQGANARRLAESTYDRRHVTAQFAAMLRSVLAAPRS